jgi:hypothetical protein
MNRMRICTSTCNARSSTTLRTRHRNAEFAATANRVTAELAARRNAFAAALADEVWFAHITPGGQLDRLARIDSV